jgi:hypothetical protein
VALFFVTPLVSVGCLAWKAFLDPLFGAEGSTDLQLVPFSLIAYLTFLAGAFVSLLSLWF